MNKLIPDSTKQQIHSACDVFILSVVILISAVRSVTCGQLCIKQRLSCIKY